MVSQAHLLLMLYGPLLPESKITLSYRDLTSWEHVNEAGFCFVDQVVSKTLSSTGSRDLVARGLPLSGLWDLARAILLLYDKLDEAKGQSTTSLLAIVEELIGITLQGSHMFSRVLEAV